MTLTPDEICLKAAALLPGLLDDLERLVAYPSVAFPGFPQEPVLACAQETLAVVQRAGLPGARLIDLDGGYPAIWAEAPAPPGRPTVLLYAHYDVQPAPLEQGWTGSPWRLRRGADGRCYGRGAADDKSGILIHSGALHIFEGQLPVGIKLIIEGEEETNSHLSAFVEKHPEMFQADVYLIPDMGNLMVGEPVLTTALRGHVGCTLEVRTIAQPLHSGLFGGAAPDALVALIRILSRLHDEQGNTCVPGVEGFEWQGAPFPEDLYRQQAGILPGVQLVGDGDLASRLWARPSLSVLGMDVTRLAEASNVIIPRASARIAMRIPPGSDAQADLQRLVDYLLADPPWGAQVEVLSPRASPAFVTRTDGPACTAALHALEQVYDRQPSQVGSGGSIPLLNLLAKISPQAEFILWGAEDLAQARIHGPDESVDPTEIERMTAAEAITLLELGRTHAG